MTKLETLEHLIECIVGNIEIPYVAITSTFPGAAYLVLPSTTGSLDACHALQEKFFSCVSTNLSDDPSGIGVSMSVWPKGLVGCEINVKYVSEGPLSKAWLICMILAMIEMEKLNDT